MYCKYWRSVNALIDIAFSIGNFKLLLYACRGWREVRYHAADYAEKIKMAAVQTRSGSLYSYMSNTVDMIRIVKQLHDRQIRTDGKHKSRYVSTRKRNMWSPLADACCPDLYQQFDGSSVVRLIRKFTIRQIRTVRIRTVKWLYSSYTVRTKRTIRENDWQIVNL